MASLLFLILCLPLLTSSPDFAVSLLLISSCLLLLPLHFRLGLLPLPFLGFPSIILFLLPGLGLLPLLFFSFAVSLFFLLSRFGLLPERKALFFRFAVSLLLLYSDFRLPLLFLGFAVSLLRI